MIFCGAYLKSIDEGNNEFRGSEQDGKEQRALHTLASCFFFLVQAKERRFVSLA